MAEQLSVGSTDGGNISQREASFQGEVAKVNLGTLLQKANTDDRVVQKAKDDEFYERGGENELHPVKDAVVTDKRAGVASLVISPRTKTAMEGQGVGT